MGAVYLRFRVLPEKLPEHMRAIPGIRGAENTVAQVGQRAAGAFGTAVLSSFYTEYKPEITNLLGAVFRRGKQPTTGTGAHK